MFFHFSVRSHFVKASLFFFSSSFSLTYLWAIVFRFAFCFPNYYIQFSKFLFSLRWISRHKRPQRATLSSQLKSIRPYKLAVRIWTTIELIKSVQLLMKLWSLTFLWSVCMQSKAWRRPSQCTPADSMLGLGWWQSVLPLSSILILWPLQLLSAVPFHFLLYLPSQYHEKGKEKASNEAVKTITQLRQVIQVRWSSLQAKDLIS